MAGSNFAGSASVRQTVLTAIAIALLLLSGCQRKAKRPIGVVRGKVTLAGRPVTQGMIVFDNPGAGVTTMVPITADGSYNARTYNEAGLPVGHYRVAVSAQQFTNSGVVLIDREPGKPTPVTTAIPDKYGKIETSPLTADVKEGDNPAFDFDLAP